MAAAAATAVEAEEAMEMAEAVAKEEEEMAAVVTEAEEMEAVEVGGSVAVREVAEVAAGSAEARGAVAGSAATEAWGLDTQSTHSTRSWFQRNCRFEAMRKRSCKSVLMPVCSSRNPVQPRKTMTLYSEGSAGSAAGLAGSVAGSAALEDWAADWATAGVAADWAGMEGSEAAVKVAVAQDTEAKSNRPD